MERAFFELDGTRYLATAATRGPWSKDHQHGGPPSALLARALERELGEGMRIASLQVEFLRPMPVGAAMELSTRAGRAGKKVRTAQASLTAEGVELARAHAVATRTLAPGGEVFEVARGRWRPKPPHVGEPAPLEPALTAPDASEPFQFPFFKDLESYASHMEGKRVAGEFGAGAFTVWMRMKIPLLLGESPSSLQRVAIAADSGNGISLALDPAKYTSINPELTVYLWRPLRGEWVGLSARTHIGPDGIGAAESALYDEGGRVGRSLQSLVLEAR